MKIEKNKKVKIYYILAGCVLSVLSMLPFFIMGKNSIITYHDQLDGEMIAYILNAKHLFEGMSSYPELMNGIPSAGMMPPAPIFVILFKIFSPFVSFLMMATISKISAFVSMFLLSEKATGKKWIGFLSGIVFMMIPFYPVYGLSITGQAFVWYALFVFADKNSQAKEKISSVVLSLVFALTSSLALVGYAVITVSFLASLILIIRNRKLNKFIFFPVMMGIVYMFTNIPLVKQMLHIGKMFVSHKSELYFQTVGFINSIRINIMGEDTYTNCFQWVILGSSVLFIIVSIVLSKEKRELIKSNKSLLFNIAFITLVILFIGAYNSKPIVNIRNLSSGMLHEFNFSRFSWMLPIAWFLLFSQSISILDDSVNHSKKIRALSFVLASISAMIVFFMAGMKGDIKPTIMRMIKGSSYRQITYSQFYSEDMFREVEKLIGKNKEDYRVISVGLPPACAAYNGFYCLDAYSNNYDVEYKHQFRHIISKELEKSDYYTFYFDDWGNRCYAFLADYSYLKNDRNEHTVFNNISLDFDAAKNMGAEYVISTSPIINEEALGLTLLNDTPITSDDAWYDLYVYEIN